MANAPPFFANLISIFIILINLGCFIIFPTSRYRSKHPRKPSPTSPLGVSPTKRKPYKSVSSSWSYIKKIFSSKRSCGSIDVCHLVDVKQEMSVINPDTRPTARPGSLTESDYLPLHNEMHPCPNCGEIFHKHGLLEQHQAMKHAICELMDDDPGKNVVQIIFGSGWSVSKSPTIHRVMKIHNSPKILTRFEEYRESIKLMAARQRRDPRCIADGNELLRFHCTTFICDLGKNGNSTICSGQYCSLCGIIRSGFSPKLDGISTLSNSYRGHMTIHEDIEEEFGFMNVKRAMLVCRVIAGRVGCDSGMCGKNDPGYDSLVGREPSAVHTRLDDEDELIVFNPRAVLPCFVIVYTV